MVGITVCLGEVSAVLLSTTPNATVRSIEVFEAEGGLRVHSVISSCHVYCALLYAPTENSSSSALSSNQFMCHVFFTQLTVAIHVKCGLL